MDKSTDADRLYQVGTVGIGFACDALGITRREVVKRLGRPPYTMEAIDREIDRLILLDSGFDVGDEPVIRGLRDEFLCVRREATHGNGFDSIAIWATSIELSGVWA